MQRAFSYGSPATAVLFPVSFHTERQSHHKTRLIDDKAWLYQRLTQMAEHLRCPQIACASGGGSAVEPEDPCWDFVGSD